MARTATSSLRLLRALHTHTLGSWTAISNTLNNDNTSLETLSAQECEQEYCRLLGTIGQTPLTASKSGHDFPMILHMYQIQQFKKM